MDFSVVSGMPANPLCLVLSVVLLFQIAASGSTYTTHKELCIWLAWCILFCFSNSRFQLYTTWLLTGAEVNWTWGICPQNIHDDGIKWKHFPRNWPFVRGIHRSTVNSPHKGQWRGALMFSLICVWINGWVNNREAGDLIRYLAHYNVIVISMALCQLQFEAPMRWHWCYWTRVTPVLQ